MNVHEWNGHLEIFSRLQVTENSEKFTEKTHVTYYANMM